MTLGTTPKGPELGHYRGDFYLAKNGDIKLAIDNPSIPCYREIAEPRTITDPITQFRNVTAVKPSTQRGATDAMRKTLRTDPTGWTPSALRWAHVHRPRYPR